MHVILLTGLLFEFEVAQDVFIRDLLLACGPLVMIIVEMMFPLFDDQHLIFFCCAIECGCRGGFSTVDGTQLGMLYLVLYVKLAGCRISFWKTSLFLALSFFDVVWFDGWDFC